MILDATAGNRTMWKVKDSEHIVYIDRQQELQMKPTIFCDNMQTPFKDKTFDSIFYDPPHAWGQRSHFYSYPKWTEEYYAKYNDKTMPRYYGWDQYDSWGELVIHLYKASAEFYRILKDDGILWLKWNEMERDITLVLSTFSQWTVMMQLYIKSPSQTAGDKQTYWVMQMKNKEAMRQSHL